MKELKFNECVGQAVIGFIFLIIAAITCWGIVIFAKFLRSLAGS
jgi:hypothetical protein